MNTMRTTHTAPFLARVRTRVLLGLGLLAAAVAAPGVHAADTASAAAGETAAAPVTAIFAKALHVGDGTTLENGLIVIRDGKIVAVTAGGTAPGGATVIRMDEAHVTPGLIDANARLEPRDLVAANARAAGRTPLAQLLDCGIHDTSACSCNGASICQLSHVHDQFEGEGDAVCPVCGYPAPPGIADLIAGVQSGGSTPTESSSEVVPHTMVVDALNLRSADLERLAAEGVTTVYASPDNAAVIGPRGAIIRTAGPIGDRIVVEAAAVHATMGSDSFRVGGGNSPPFRQFVGVNTRRPGSRMGVAWVFRKAMYDTINDARGFEIGGADTPPMEALPVLAEVLQGEVPIRFAARAQRDIEGAFRLAREFGLSFTLVEGIEAHTTLQMLTDTNTSVVFGPISMERGGFRNEADTRFTTARDLLAAGVRTALSAMDRREEDGLARQAMYAMKSGVSFEDALRAVTLTPAEILGIDGDTGSLSVGKRADLVIWSGEPFAATSRPMMVMVGGEVALDRRATTD
jgi:imidazolonepropionase-like amidohydrolase